MSLSEELAFGDFRFGLNLALSANVMFLMNK